MLGRGLESLIPSQHGRLEPDAQQTDGASSERHEGASFDRSVPPLVAMEASAGLTSNFRRPILNEPKQGDSFMVSRVEPSRIDGPVFHIETTKIEPNPFQPRKIFEESALKELAASIGEFGIMQPLLVSKIETPTERGLDVKYQLIAGERRWLAAKMIGLQTVPVIIKTTSEEREKLELAIVENLQRADLNPVETARAYAKLQDHFGLTQREIAARLGKSREVVGNAMRLLSLPSYLQDALCRGQISESQGRLLLAVADSAAQQSLFNDILRKKLSVRELRGRIGRINRKDVEPVSVPAVDPELREAQEKLQQMFGTKVELQKRGEAGKITFDFYSNDELRAILARLLGEQVSPQPSGELVSENNGGMATGDMAASDSFTV